MLFLVAAAVMLANEPVRFDANHQPQFTSHQIQNASPATRSGLARWAATPHGRRMIDFFAAQHCEISVVEDDSENAMGRAPEPGIATMVSKRKTFVMLLNPTFFQLPKDMAPLPGQPANASDAMAIAWAGEMLHIYFYARGISLPHHERPDFQEQWSAMAGELGMATVRHDDGDAFGRSVVVRYIGR
ncbi:MAG TPA: hypothetical protein VJ853_01760 [Thermoanaerobaculia bacterium]|nr:hypothetical protein [Thermoanaerobaculia bacterium]